MNFIFSGIREPYNHNNDGKLNPELAENWTSEDGGKTWTVNLRTGVTWHKVGRNFTANDVTATFERLKTLGADSYYYYAARDIESIEAIDNTTLKVVMKEGSYASCML